MKAYVIKRDDGKYLKTRFESGYFNLYETTDYVDELYEATLYSINNFELINNRCKYQFKNCKPILIEIKEIKQPVRLLPCICGSKYRELWNTTDNCYYYKCSKCGLQTPNAKTKIRLKEIWNEMIKEKTENKL